MDIFEIMDSLFRLKKQGDDFGIYFDGKLLMKLVNCKNVSMDFIKDHYEMEKEFIVEDNFEVPYEEVDMSEILEEQIREGDWDWKREVKEYVGN